MIGAMSDNVDNLAGIDALPPFWLFPWFFVLPGVLAGLLGVSAMRRQARPPADVVRREPVEERGGVA
jgi:hypothetical protein